MNIFKFILLLSIFNGLYSMEQEGPPKELVETSSYFMVLHRDKVSLYKGAVVQNLFLSACSIAREHAQRHNDIARMLQETEKPVVLFCNAQNEPLKHYVFDNETRERIDQFRALLDPLCKPNAIKYEMSFQREGTYVELKDKDNFLLGAGSYKGKMEEIREQVQSDFAHCMEIDPDLFAPKEVIAPAATEKQKSWSIKSLFKKGE